MSYLRGLLCVVASTLFVVLIFGGFAACGGATSTGIGDAPTGAGNGTGSDAQVSGSDGSSTVDGGASDTGIVKDGGGGPTGSDPGLVSCPPGLVKCTTKSATPPPAEYCCIEASAAGTPIGTCKSEAVSACGGHRLGCDEKLDCAGEDVCCAEGSSSGPGGGEKVVTRCMPTCITGAPRIQVCKSDKECENGGPCTAYDCGDNIPPHLRFCEKPEGCK